MEEKKRRWSILIFLLIEVDFYVFDIDIWSWKKRERFFTLVCTVCLLIFFPHLWCRWSEKRHERKITNKQNEIAKIWIGFLALTSFLSSFRLAKSTCFTFGFEKNENIIHTSRTTTNPLENHNLNHREENLHWTFHITNDRSFRCRCIDNFDTNLCTLTLTASSTKDFDNTCHNTTGWVFIHTENLIFRKCGNLEKAKGRDVIQISIERERTVVKFYLSVSPSWFVRFWSFTEWKKFFSENSSIISSDLFSHIFIFQIGNIFSKTSPIKSPQSSAIYSLDVYLTCWQKNNHHMKCSLLPA